jgi:glycine/D-amino acid oxidase-like deaminating enzyme
MTGSLRSTSSPDVIVIGGGICGVAAAAHVAEAGRRVLLLERTGIGAGASGRNSGVVQHPFDPVLVELHLETVERYRAVAVAGDGTFRLPADAAGLLSVTHDPAVARVEAQAIAATHPALQATYLDPVALQELEPTMAPGVAACRLEIGFPVGPATATRAYAAHADRIGVAIEVGVGARPWLTGARAAGVVTDDGRRIPAADVVVAAGPWSPALVDPSGGWRPITPLWGVVVTVELAEPPRHVLEEAVSEIPIDDTGVKATAFSFSLVTAEGASSLGSTFLDTEPEAATLVPDLVARGATFVPAIARAPTGTVRACARPLSRDGRPLVGRVPELDGCWIVAGHGPWGISTGPASGRILADLLTGAMAAPPVSLDPGRFGAPLAP